MADIKKLIKDINKKFGANAIRLGSDIKQDMNFKIPLGSVGLNDALGGGLPSGRYITLAGQESSGKSFLAYKAIATVQAMKKKTVTDSSGFEYEIVAEDGYSFTGRSYSNREWKLYKRMGRLFRH